METSLSGERHRSLGTWRSRFPLQTMFVEVISIILGVVLALSVNEWRETTAQERRAEAAFEQIMQEVRSNQNLIAVIHQSNQETLVGLNGPDDLEENGESQFIPGIQVNSTAWETAKSTGVFNHVEYEQILKLSQVYSIQEIYRTYGFGLIQALMNGTSVAAANGHPWNESEAIKKFESSLRILVDLEAALLDMYSDILEEEVD